MNKQKQPGLFVAFIAIYLAHWIIQTFEKWLGLGLQ